MRKLLSGSILALTLCVGLSGWSLAQSAPLKVGTVHREPFVFLQKNKITDGFSIELWKEIADRNGYVFNWQLEEKFPELLEKVERAQVDLAIANISITSGREKVMDFSQPIYDSGLQILVPKGGGGRI